MKYCIKYRIIDYPMAASPAYPYVQAGLFLTKEEADELVDRLNHEDDLRVERIKSEGKYTTVYHNYFAVEVE